MPTIRKIFTAALLAIGIAASAFAFDVTTGELTVADPVLRATSPRAPVSGGYMTIANSGSEADRLKGASADFAGKVEVHSMEVVDDVMRMRAIEGGLEIPPGGEVVLKPGGYHLMFMRLDEQLQAGETRKVILVFERAGEVEIEFTVKQIRPGQGHSG